MLNSGGKFDSNLFSMGFQNFGSSQGIDMSQFSLPSSGTGFQPLGGINQIGMPGSTIPIDPNRNQQLSPEEELRIKQEKKLKKKREKAKKRKAEKRRRAQLKAQKLAEIRAREAADLKKAQQIMANKAEKNADLAQKELEDERERAKLEEEERKRREEAEKLERERQIRLKEKRNEQLWIHFQGICYHYMAPLIFFETIRNRVSKQRLPSYAAQTKVFSAIKGVMSQYYKSKLEKWLLEFYKNSSKYIVTDNQALIKEYSCSVPRKDQIEDRVSTYILKKFTTLIDEIVKSLNPKEKNQAFFAALIQQFENRTFPLANIYFEMEIKRVEFDVFGRLKNMHDMRKGFLLGSYFLNKIFFEEIITKPEDLGFKTKVKVKKETRLAIRVFCSLIYNLFQFYCSKSFKIYGNNEYHLGREKIVKRRKDIIYFDIGNPKKDKIPEIKNQNSGDESIFRDLVPRDDFSTAFGKPDVMEKFVIQIKRLFDELAKYGIDFYNVEKEKREIQEEDIKKVEREEAIKQISERIEICKTVTRAENKKKKKKKEPEFEEVEVEEEIEIEVTDDEGENDKEGPKIRYETGPNGEQIEVIEEEVPDDEF